MARTNEAINVAECAKIGVADDPKRQSLPGFLSLNQDANHVAEDVVGECVALVRDRIGPVADSNRWVAIDRLPKTRMSKTLPATINDPAILDEITMGLQSLGLAQTRD
ncbi:AMP-binding enzyme [Tabrizicola sp.]|uniref:AMP-binding enzyme n=1 Tax=Tabrizicola sp. TaxID=2005166 RepID=UPI00386703BE